MKRPAFYFVVLVSFVHLSMIFVSVIRCFDLIENDKKCEAKQEIERSLALVTAQSFALYAAEKSDETLRNALSERQKKKLNPVGED